MVTHLYPRQKRRLFTIGGIFDDFSDTTKSGTKWFETWTGTNVVKSFVAAPGSVGGNALKLIGTIGDGLGLDACGALSPFPNKSSLYYISPLNPYRYKMKAEFRMRIDDDEVDAGNLLSCSSGFCLDGAVNWHSDYCQQRTYVLFSVANQRVGIGTGHITSGKQINIVYSEAWAGVIDTWYDVRIEWEHDYHATTGWFYTSPVDSDIPITVKVYVNNILLFTEDVTMTEWRQDGGNISQSYPFGRAGPSIVIENDGSAINGNYVEAYFKDVLITRDVELLSFEYNDSIVSRKYITDMSANIKAKYPRAITKGMDVQLYNRNSLTDNFVGCFRGIIRETEELPGKSRLRIEVERYDTIFNGEKTENNSYITQTAGAIVADIVDTPHDKYLFDTSTYFDTTTATYTRAYLNLFKIEPMMEMASLEGFILFLDEANNWHFQNHYTNESDIHLIYGEDRIISFKYDETFIRQANFVRVIGSGVQATRQIAEESFGNLSVVYRNINRLDLTTQTEVNNALDYYMSAVLEPVRVVELKIRANYLITKGINIRITVPQIDLDNTEVIVLSVYSDVWGMMTLKLLEVRPHTVLLLSELYQRTEQQESNAFPSDDLTNEEVVKIEGVCDCYISFFFTIMDSYLTEKCVMSGQGVITNKCLELFTNFWTTDNPPDLVPTSLRVGDGTTLPKPSDTALDNELYAVIPARQGDINKEGSEFGCSYKIEAWGASNSFDCSEIGLFDASGYCYARAVFPTQSLDRSLAEIRCWIKITPKHGPVMMSYGFPSWMTGYLENEPGSVFGSLWKKMMMGKVVGSKSFTVPHLFNYDETEDGAKIVTVPRYESAMDSWTMTKIADRYMVKHEWTYTFDYAERHVITDGDAPTVWLALDNNELSLLPYIMLFFRTDKLLSEYQDYFFHIVIWLRFRRGDVDPLRQYGDPDDECPKC